jgi:hypothetical protein
MYIQTETLTHPLTHSHTHTLTQTYTYVCMCVRAFVWSLTAPQPQDYKKKGETGTINKGGKTCNGSAVFGV